MPIIGCLCGQAFAQTNPPYAVDTTTPTVISGVTHYGDIFPVPWNKFNSNVTWDVQGFSNVNANVSSLSNTVAGNGTSISNNTAAITALLAQAVTNATASATNVVSGGSATASLILSNGYVVLKLGIPAGTPGTNGATGAPGATGAAGTNGAAGAPGTNTVTAYSLTNAWLGSFNNVVYSTNNIVWGTSNYLGTVPGISSVFFIGGMLGSGGMDFPTNVDQSVYACTNGTNWFVICTNGGAATFTTTNPVQLAVAGAGGGLGSIEVDLIDHPELLGRTNGGYGQVYSFNYPVNAADPATKQYTDNLVANSVGGSAFVRSADTNGVVHSTLSVNGNPAIDVTIKTVYPLRAVATSGTNILLYVNLTNLVSGWAIYSTTNLALNYSWTTFTNWTSMTTNVVGGVSNTVTFTIPFTPPGAPVRFFDVRGQKSSTLSIMLPTTMTFLSLTNCTVTSSTNSTLNLPIGSLCTDTNYLYLVAGTNSGASNWRRLAWPTNAW